MKIFYIDTVYSLFLGLLLDSNFNKNLYIFDINIPKSKLGKFRNSYLISKIEYKTKCEKYWKYYQQNKELDKILKNLKHVSMIYLQDHLSYSQYLFNNYNYPMFLLEDGTLNYNIEILEEELKKEEKLKINNYFRRVFIEKVSIKYKRFGLSNKIKKIYLTGILPIPELIKDKVEIIDIEKKWNELSLEKKREILDIFDIKLESLENLKNEKDKVLLITQPLSEDNILSEEDKINIYNNILKERNIKKVYIKSHPREKTDYSKVLKDIEVVIIEKEFPIEIFMLLNMKFKKVITLFSTAALNFKNKYDVEFIGTKNYKVLYDKFGIIGEDSNNEIAEKVNL